MNFDEIIERRGTHSMKWDMMEPLHGVPAEDGIAMWVADMDFRPPAAVQEALQAMLDHGVYGYFGDQSAYLEAIRWWMKTRHGWALDTDHVLTVNGVVNGVGLCLDEFTQPGDGVVLMTPVYHAFGRVIRAAGREVVEMEMPEQGGVYVPDTASWDAKMTGNEKLFILCSPHNPGGRVWTQAELEAIAAFCARHDLLLISDEIHHDLVYPGHTHVPMTRIAGVEDRLIMMTAATKSFNMAGAHLGNVTIPNGDLRKRFANRMGALGTSPNAFGMHMVTAAYSPAGAEWIDALTGYLDGNRRIFDEVVNAIPGLRSMPLESTYLAWVDFSGTGMERDEFTRRVEQDARIAINRGPVFGRGGDSFLRFNFATPRARVEEAAERLRRAFGDLQ